MRRWDQLYEQFARADTARREEQARAKALANARLELERWCEGATDEVMKCVRRTAAQRAAELRDRTGRSVRIDYPSRPTIAGGPDGPIMTFLRLSVDGSEVHLYSHRGPGGLPFLHFVQTASEPAVSHRHARLLSVPGCFIARRADDSWELRRVKTDGADALAVDDLVYRGFELLLSSFSRASFASTLVSGTWPRATR